MPKIRVLFTKEELEEVELKDHVVVIFDILLATSTITSALAYGAKEIIPVLDKGEAELKARNKSDQNLVLAGEYMGFPIEGFHFPNPMAVNKIVKNRCFILSTTNGTVATRKAVGADTIYLGSLLNLNSLASWLIRKHPQQDLVLVSSGSGGSFCLEDFYGVGGFIHHLFAQGSYRMTDAAQAALMLYQNEKRTSLDVLSESRVGKMMLQQGLDEDLVYVSKENQFEIIPVFVKDAGTIKEVRQYESSR